MAGEGWVTWCWTNISPSGGSNTETSKLWLCGPLCTEFDLSVLFNPVLMKALFVVNLIRNHFILLNFTSTYIRFAWKLTWRRNSLLDEWFCTKTRFDSNWKGNSKMPACCCILFCVCVFVYLLFLSQPAWWQRSLFGSKLIPLLAQWRWSCLRT